MVELVAFKIDFGSTQMFRHTLGKIERARTSDIMLEQAIQLSFEARIGFGMSIRFFQI